MNSGKLKSLGVTDVVRSPFIPDLLNFQQNGIEGMDIGFWLAACLPARNPRATVEFTQPLGQLEAYQVKDHDQR